MHIKRIISACLFLSMNVAVPFAYAEGSYQVGLNQPLYEFSRSGESLYVDVLNSGEVINVSLCGDLDAHNVRVQIFDPANNPVLDEEKNEGTIACNDLFTAPLADPIRYTTTTTGSYRIELDNAGTSGDVLDILRRFDISITPDANTNPDPTVAAGRLWSKKWVFSTRSFAETEATDADYYALAPGGRSDSNYVWKLDLNKLSGNFYSIIANDFGVDAPGSGYSVEEGSNSSTPKFPVYLGYPIVAEQRPIDPPLISDFRFIDSDGQDYAISPTDTPGVQDNGLFEFTTDVTGTYAVTIDTNSDGIFGANDVLLLGNTVNGLNQVNWGGEDSDNNPISNGTYRARLQVRLGEYHFIAQDVETSGGPGDDGLTVYLANSDGSVGDTLVYWDDATFLGGTTTLPDGALASTSAGKHTWGDFSETGFGDKTYIDTYVYGLTSSQIALTAISSSDVLFTGTDGSISVPVVGLVGTNVDITVTDSDLNLLPGIVEFIIVQAVNDRTGETEQVTLTETGPSTGVFTGNLLTAAGANAGTNNDGTLNTTYDDILSITYQDQLDSTGQSVPRTTQHVVSLDSDTDGILDDADLDADNDGIPDSIEGDATVDTDGDGTPDFRDQDSDDDGINDIIEAGGVDADNDGQVDNFTDTNDDGLDDTLAVTPLPITDSNGDDTPDYRDNSDSDGDGILDSLDLDSDNDAIPDSIEGDASVDTDADGVADYLDLDSDNDGIPDLTESGITNPAALDSNSDARIDDTNTVGDNGLADVVETVADSGQADYDGDGNVDTPRDTDTDGIADFRDLDSDGDNISDIIEAGGADADTDGQADGFTDANTDGLDDTIAATPLPLPDSDSDGLPDYRDNDDNNDNDSDSDNDGITDTLDLDDDNDGIPDSVEGDGAVDTDDDGVVDSLDLDSDNDGLTDLTESGITDPAAFDSDNDGRIDNTNTVGDNGLADAVETATDSGEADYDGDGNADAPRDTDADGVADFRDLDSDNDGIPDVTEAGGNDPDGDGILGDGVPTVDGNGLPPGSGLTPLDTDDDGTPNNRDLDSDDDNISDIIEAGGADADNDGQADGFTDANNDGLDDTIAAAPLPLPDSDDDGLPDYRDNDDIDNDGIADALDLDDDNDGILDSTEADGAVDTDGDGIPDSRDRDSDNDGLFDLTESGSTDPAVLDSDNDGRIDNTNTVGANGLADVVETAVDSGEVDYDGDGNADAPRDTDTDGVADFRDLDSDNDGIPDVTEAGGSDPDGDGLRGSGVPSVNSDNGATGGVSLASGDLDADGVPDHRDLDTDNDGIPDVVESDGQDADADALLDGFTDTNGDGLDDATTTNPSPRPDTDNDGTDDYRDLDSDNDGVNDLVEAGGVDIDGDDRVDNPMDANSDGFDDRLVGTDNALPLPDQDGDGIADYRDADAAGGVSPLSESQPLRTGLSGIGGCTLSSGTETPVDPTLPLILLISLLYLMRRNVRLSLIKRNKK